MSANEPSFSDFIPGAGMSDDVVACAGSPLRLGDPRASREDVIEALRTVYDPEIPVNIYDLGLVYKLSLNESGSLAIQMTLTAPACPVAGQMPQTVADAVAAVSGVGEVVVRLVWDPPWSPDRMSEDARLALGMP